MHRITLFQLAVLMPVAVALSGWQTTVAQSFAAGGLVAVIPHFWFARRVFRWQGAQRVQHTVRSGYAAEIGKYLLSVMGFALVFAKLRPISGLAVFAGYAAMLLVQIAGAWWLLRHPPKAPGHGAHTDSG